MSEATAPTPPAASELPDAQARARIIAERQRNVCIVAGAGTGKTTAIVRRLVGMLAPDDDQIPVTSIDRVAAITFTRRAAGELRLRIRELLLSELSLPKLSATRAERLRAALSGLDVAFVGTIHAFADRLLRRRPTEARLSPAYELVEDIQPLVAETLRRLLRAVERDELREALGAWGADLDDDRIREAAVTIRAAQRAGITLERRASSWGELPSLEGLIQNFIETRDALPTDPPGPPPGIEALVGVGRDLARECEHLPPEVLDTPGGRWLTQVAQRLMAVGRDPAGAVGLIQEIMTRRMKLGRHFSDQYPAWNLYRRLIDDRSVWYARIAGPHRWLGARLVRLAPVAVALYEQVRSERQVVDFLDVLVRLRDLLRDRLDVRQEFQQLFDAVFVDEFQDTDPLQCEIVFYLCEDGAHAHAWSEVRLAPGRLTLVGDPQQSIYRFRRADIAMYVEAMTHMEEQGALMERLTTNFRSRPSLVGWFNHALPRVLGEPGTPWDAQQGRVPYQPLDPAPTLPEFQPAQSVLVLNYTGPGQTPLPPWEGRPVEAEAVALLLQNLVRPDSRMRIRDQETGRPRPIRPADVAVLTESMTDVPLLLAALSRLGMRSTVRGGRLLLEHPLIKEMLLGFCALCDARDGVAIAALMRPPFFPLEETAGLDPEDMAWGVAQETVAMLRAERATRTPGALMRDLIERTGLTQALLLEVNGAELLAACYDVAMELDRRAALRQLDVASAARLARAWATEPIPLIAPEPTGHEAIRILTVYQAKGMEFPVVVLWDGFRSLQYRREPDWLVDRDGARWAMRLGDMVFEHPEGCRMLQTERALRSRERERLAYVAATRARDLLLIPLPLRDRSARDRNRLLAEAVEVPRLPYVQGEEPGWHRAGEPITLPEPVPDEDLEMALTAQALHAGAAMSRAGEEALATFPLTQAAAATAQELAPEAAAFASRQVDLDDEGLEDDERDVFSAAVHSALALVVTARSPDPGDASHRAARAFEIPHLRLNIATHVQRTFATLIERGFYPGAAVMHSAVPVVLPLPGDRRLLAGHVDLLVQTGQEVWIVDFRTDPPPAHPSRLSLSYPEVIVELDLVSKALQISGALDGLELHRCVLFTRTGELIEVGGVD